MTFAYWSWKASGGARVDTEWVRRVVVETLEKSQLAVDKTVREEKDRRRSARRGRAPAGSSWKELTMVGSRRKCMASTVAVHCGGAEIEKLWSASGTGV